MRSNRFPLTQSVLSSSLLALGLSFTSTAFAQETCEADTCPAGFECEETMAPCLTIACVDDTCESSCESTTMTNCVPATCESDADCGSAMVCASRDIESCIGDSRPCAVGEECLVVETSCTTETIQECTPTWQLPCSTADDCGAGFECVEAITEWCSGSSGGSTGAADAEADPVVEESTEECGSEPTGEFYCKAIETACAVDADCLEGWTCIDNPDGACWADSEGNTGCDVPDPARLCRQPYAEYTGGWMLGGATLAESDLASANSAETQGTEVPRAAAADGTSEESGTADETPSGASNSGCSVGLGLGSTGGNTAALLLGLAAALRARRRRDR